jgi:hypothetical protein
MYIYANHFFQSQNDRLIDVANHNVLVVYHINKTLNLKL